MQRAWSGEGRTSTVPLCICNFQIIYHPQKSVNSTQRKYFTDLNLNKHFRNRNLLNLNDRKSLAKSRHNVIVSIHSARSGATGHPCKLQPWSIRTLRLSLIHLPPEPSACRIIRLISVRSHCTHFHHDTQIHEMAKQEKNQATNNWNLTGWISKTFKLQGLGFSIFLYLYYHGGASESHKTRALWSTHLRT